MFDPKYFIDVTGLSYFWQKVKSYIDSQILNIKPDLATQEKDGLMSAADKTKLDNIENSFPVYDASTVLFKNNLIITTDVGVHKIDPDIGYKELPTAGKSIEQVFELLYSDKSAI